MGSGDPTGLVPGDGAGIARIDALCALAVRSLPVDGASVTYTFGVKHSGLICGTDPVATWLDELQSALGEGPAVDAVTGGQPVLPRDLADPTARTRWPVFTAAAIDAGVLALFALPLQIGVINLGVLALHRRTAGELSAAQLAQALRLADGAAYAILDLAAPAGAFPRPDGAADGVFVGAEIHQASGMVMVQLQIPIDAALARLRAYAFAHDRPLIVIAREVIAHMLQLER